ncbi:tellurite resistance protein-related protein [Oleiphilus messinensis]|uniref:Tellurite resistance protein-related protein n=1 Tax=Oleiphilus messinensis TaxID=141451 RepID=A0A1Y0ICS9_9GAMM|nr:class I SAM-dependent methyltransferase [Oleiphilus messinensis]ARU58060.1 tellurite resistance protein-related protein [Oleiphilus messinensis]
MNHNQPDTSDVIQNSTTDEYYNQHAGEFFETTVKLDMSATIHEFSAHLPENAHILDAGCGSGRDSKLLIELGYNVTAFDASSKLARLASEYLGQPVLTCTFSQFKSNNQFDGIWACASLLHIPAPDMSQTLCHLSQYLKPEGVFYASFKYGSEDICKDGRNFTNCTESRLADFVQETQLSIIKTWKTPDTRPERVDEYWLNALLRKNGSPTSP